MMTFRFDMKIRKITYRMYPNEDQHKLLLDILGVHQHLYNKALEERIKSYKEEGKTLSWYDQKKTLTQWRKDDEKLRNVNSHSEQQTLKRLHLAYQAFFRRVKKGEKAGFPRFKTFQRFKGWGYCEHGNGWTFLHKKVRLMGIGLVTLRGKAKTPGVPKTADVLHKNGKWYLSVTYVCEPKRQRGQKAIGLDWGLENFATLAVSDNTTQAIENPRFGKLMSQKIKETHQKISRSKKGSNNRKKIISKLANHYRKLANQRKDFAHQQSAKIVSNCALIATEKLNIKNMTVKGGSYKKGLNREILNTTPGEFISMLKYKAEEAGVEFIEVPTRLVKPSQTCHGCGIVSKKPLSQRWHSCECSAECSRDENAARVMLNWALFGSATGQELAEMRRGGSLTPMSH